MDEHLLSYHDGSKIGLRTRADGKSDDVASGIEGVSSSDLFVSVVTIGEVDHGIEQQWTTRYGLRGKVDFKAEEF